MSISVTGTRRTAGLVTVAATAVALAVAAQPASARPSAQHYAPLHFARGEVITQTSHRLAPPTSGVTRSRADHKTARAQAYYDQTQSMVRLARRTSADALARCGNCAPKSHVLHIGRYRVQMTENWCGPTALSVIADYLNLQGKAAQGSKRWSRSDSDYTQELRAANLVLDQSAQGTDWVGPDGVPTGGSWASKYPMQDALNYLLRTSRYKLFYDVKSLPSAPSSKQIRQFRAELVYDVNDHGRGFPLAANEYASSDHYLPGQSYSGVIMHWIAPTGYRAYGGVTTYEDPGWGNGSMKSVSTPYFVTALGGRGYVY